MCWGRFDTLCTHPGSHHRIKTAKHPWPSGVPSCFLGPRSAIPRLHTPDPFSDRLDSLAFPGILSALHRTRGRPFLSGSLRQNCSEICPCCLGCRLLTPFHCQVFPSTEGTCRAFISGPVGGPVGGLPWKYSGRWKWLYPRRCSLKHCLRIGKGRDQTRIPRGGPRRPRQDVCCMTNSASVGVMGRSQPRWKMLRFRSERGRTGDGILCIATSNFT